MSDYFGALLRSAGAAPADALAPAAPIGQADLVEQEVEVEVDASPESAAAAHSSEAPAGIEPAPSAPNEARPGARERREVMRGESVGSPFTRPALDEVHPVVRAALEWVAADPESVEGAESTSASAEPQRVSDPSPRRQRPPAPFAPPAASADIMAAAAAESLRPRHAPALPPFEHRAAHEAEPAPARAAAPIQSSPVGDLDLALRPSSRAWQPVVTTMDEPAPPQDRVEVNIGTIHVRVDAPAARAVVQPAPPPPRPPQPARPADRGSFSRSRVPRI